MTEQEGDEYYVCVKNSMFPNNKSYKLAMLQTISQKFIKEGKLGLEFSEPRQALLIECDDKKKLYMFFRQLKIIISGKKIKLCENVRPKTLPAEDILGNRFDPMALQFVSIKRFDNRVLNMIHLKKLVLENCDLPVIPFQLGQLCIEYFSISGSKLPTSINEQNVFWNWTSIITICKSLTTLKLDSIGLKKLPFEIFFLKNLNTLSASNNSLTYLPQCIGDLKKLERLFVADNSLMYFPHILSRLEFKEMDISNNSFQLPKHQIFDNIKMYLDVVDTVPKRYRNIKPLSLLSFYKVMDNWIPFKRQDIPHTLWIFFDVVGRCMLCDKWILPNYFRVTHYFALPELKSLVKDHNINNIPWQSLTCNSFHNCRRRV